jgi:hypothetical protein
MTNYEVVKKLIGDVRPKGDASRDYKILENLKALIQLHSEIHKAIDDVAYDYKDSKEGTIKMCQQEASKYLDSLGIQ